MKKSKRILSFCLALCMCLTALTGCEKATVEDVTTPLEDTEIIGGFTEMTQMTTTTELDVSEITEESVSFTTTTVSSEDVEEVTTTEDPYAWFEDFAATATTTERNEEVTVESIITTTTAVPEVTTTTTTRAPSTGTTTNAPTGDSIDLVDMYSILDTNNEAKQIYYSQLSERDKKIYDALIEAVLGFKSKVTFSEPISEEDYERIFCLVYFQNPELFWLSGRIIQSEDLKSCTLMYIYSAEQVKSYQTYIAKKTNALLGKLTTDMTDLQKALVCHNWLCVNNIFSKESENSKNVYGSLVDGTAQCEGYAKGFLYLMNKIGIPCLLITGINNQDLTHAWCKVKINGEWTNIDPTFDDSTMSAPVDYQNVSYRYMGVPDVAIYDATHFYPSTSPLNKNLVLFTPPACTTYSLNADINYGNYAKTYEEAFEKLKASCFDAVEDGRRCAHVKIATDDVYEETLRMLVDEYHIFDIKKAINAEYGEATVTTFAVSPKNKLNYIEVTMTYGAIN